MGPEPPESRATTLVAANTENDKLAGGAVVDEENIVVELNTGLRFTRIYSGPKLDVIGRTYFMTVSRDGNFLFAPLGPGDAPPGWVIPLKQGQEPFKLAGQIHYLSWSWDMRNIAFVEYPRGELY